jgi:two-component system, NarL family, response regulator NreC
MAIGILIAEDHPIYRAGLKSLLEREGFNVLGEAENGLDAIAMTGKLQPDVAVLDLSMPLLNGLDAAREIRRLSPRSRVVMLTAHREEFYVNAAISAGAQGYVVKSEAAQALGSAITEVAAGNAYLSPSVARFAVASFVEKTAGGPTELLTPRELEVLRLIALGNTNKRVAELLDLTLKMAEFFRASMMEKLDIHETATLVRYAVRRGLVTP